MTALLAPTASTARQIIDAEAVVTHFQPIYSAKQKSVIGVEALSRGIDPNTDSLVSPADLFAMAASESLSSELEDLCRDTALRTFAGNGDLTKNLLLFINVDAARMDESVVASPRELALPRSMSGEDRGMLFLNFDASASGSDPAAALLKRVRSLGLEPGQVAVEVLESRFDDVNRLRELADELRRNGFLLVLDDVGAGHSNLDRIPLIRPDVLKIDRSLIRNIDTDYHKQETVKSLAQLARKIGALVVAEGVETRAEALLSLELGADLLQGFYLARPQPVDQIRDHISGETVESLASAYRTYMIEKINARKIQHRRYSIILNTILCELARTHVENFDQVLRELVLQYPAVECLYVLDQAGIQISETVCNFTDKRPANRLMFRPAARGADHSLKDFYYVLLDVELQKYTTDPYVSLASGSVCRTISTCFRDGHNNRLYILCIDVLCA